MSAYEMVEFTVKDPDVYREQYAGNAGKAAKEYGAEILAEHKWEILDGETGLSSGVIVHFPHHGTAPARGLAMDARFGLLGGLPTPTEDAGDSE